MSATSGDAPVAATSVTCSGLRMTLVTVVAARHEQRSEQQRDFAVAADDEDAGHVGLQQVRDPRYASAPTCGPRATPASVATARAISRDLIGPDATASAHEPRTAVRPSRPRARRWRMPHRTTARESACHCSPLFG